MLVRVQPNDLMGTDGGKNKLEKSKIKNILNGWIYEPMSELKRCDRVLHNAFNLGDFDENAWYYDSKKVDEWIKKNVPWKANLKWFEQDIHKVLSAYLILLRNYNSFSLALLILYLWLLLFVAVLAVAWLYF